MTLPPATNDPGRVPAGAAPALYRRRRSGRRARAAALEFLPAALEVHETPPPPAARAILWCIVLFFGLGVAWAYIGRVDVVAVARGRIVPSGRVKVIQPVETGVIQAIHVAEGQVVERGDLLVELDPTTTGADASRLRNELLAARLKLARLRALRAVLDGDPAAASLPAAYTGEDIPVDRIRLARQLLRDQLAEYRAKLAALDQALEKHRAELRSTRLDVRRLGRILPLVSRRAAALRQLQARKLAPETDYLRLEQERIEKEQELAMARSRIGEIDARIAEAREQRAAAEAGFRRSTLADLQAAAREATAAREEYVKARERNRRRRLHAPVAGVVQQLAVHTVGGVVTPAQKLMLIVPRDERLEVEAWLANRDVGFVRAGQRAEVKVETFPFTRYGTIGARVVDVSDDAVANDKLGLVYTLRARMERSTMDVDGRRVHLTPGMAVSLEVKTGRRRLIEYFLSPLLRGLGESVRER